MTNHYATIRAALEMLKWRVLEVEQEQVNNALSALAELEKAASEPVAEVPPAMPDWYAKAAAMCTQNLSRENK